MRGKEGERKKGEVGARAGKRKGWSPARGTENGIGTGLCTGGIGGYREVASPSPCPSSCTGVDLAGGMGALWKRVVVVGE